MNNEKETQDQNPLPTSRNTDRQEFMEQMRRACEEQDIDFNSDDYRGLEYWSIKNSKQTDYPIQNK